MTSVLWESITTLQTPQESRSSYYSRDPPRGASLFDTEEIVAFDTFSSHEDGDANKQTTIIDTRGQWNSGIVFHYSQWNRYKQTSQFINQNFTPVFFLTS